MTQPLNHVVMQYDLNEYDAATIDPLEGRIAALENAMSPDIGGLDDTWMNVTDLESGRWDFATVTNDGAHEMSSIPYEFVSLHKRYHILSDTLCQVEYRAIIKSTNTEQWKDWGQYFVVYPPKNAFQGSFNTYAQLRGHYQSNYSGVSSGLIESCKDWKFDGHRMPDDYYVGVIGGVHDLRYKENLWKAGSFFTYTILGTPVERSKFNDIPGQSGKPKPKGSGVHFEDITLNASGEYDVFNSYVERRVYTKGTVKSTLRIKAIAKSISDDISFSFTQSRS